MEEDDMTTRPICDCCGGIAIDPPTRITLTPPCGHSITRVVCSDCAAAITRRFRRPRRLGPAPAERTASGDRYVAVAMPGD
jgi:hypothetical protein